MNYIFDFDGTLMDTAPVILATMRATIDELGWPQLDELVYRGSIGLRLVEIPEFLYPGAGYDGQQYATVYHRLFMLINKPGLAKPFEGVTETLRQLASRGARMAIASSRGRDSVREFTDGMGVTALFDMLVGGENVSHGKPAPDPVRLILNRLGWSAANTLVVGDADVDIKMGSGAGCRTCAVTYGNGSMRSLQASAPDYIIDSFAGIPF